MNVGDNRILANAIFTDHRARSVRLCDRGGRNAHHRVPHRGYRPPCGYRATARPGAQRAPPSHRARFARYPTLALRSQIACKKLLDGNRAA